MGKFRTGIAAGVAGDDLIIIGLPGQKCGVGEICSVRRHRSDEIEVYIVGGMFDQEINSVGRAAVPRQINLRSVQGSSLQICRSGWRQGRRGGNVQFNGVINPTGAQPRTQIA